MAIRIISTLTYLIVFNLANFSAIASEVNAEFERITKICIHPEGGFPFDAAACYEKHDNEIGHELQKVYDRLRDILGQTMVCSGKRSEHGLNSKKETVPL